MRSSNDDLGLPVPRAVGEIARRNGYVIEVSPAGHGAPLPYVAAARKLQDEAGGSHFLTYAPTASAASKDGLLVLLAVLRGDDYWPDRAAGLRDAR